MSTTLCFFFLQLFKHEMTEHTLLKPYSFTATLGVFFPHCVYVVLCGTLLEPYWNNIYNVKLILKGLA